MNQKLKKLRGVSVNGVIGKLLKTGLAKYKKNSKE